MNYRLTSFRALAFLAVFSAHSHHLHLEAGYLGVQMFFVLSGYLLTPIMVDMREGLDGRVFFAKFYARRSLRIFPLYFAYVTVVGAVCFLVPSVRDNAEVTAYIKSLPWTLTYSYNFYHASAEFLPSKLVTHFWSLAVEEQFYLFFPVILFITPREKLKHLLVGLVLLGPILRLVTQKIVLHHAIEGIGSAQDLIIYVSPFSHLDAFATGGLFALYATAKPGRYSWGAIFLCIAIGMASEYISLGYVRTIGALGYPAFMFDKPVLGYTLVNLLFGFIINQTKAGAFLPGFLSNASINYLGKISYGLYIFHFPCLFLIHEVVLRSDVRYVNDIVAFVLSVVLAALSYQFLEARFILLKDVYFPRRAR